MSDPAARVGRTREVAGVVDPWPAAALTAALGRDDPPAAGEPLPPFWHQLHLHHPVAATGPDGHEALGEFLPAFPGRVRRMWAGGRLRVERPLMVGERARKVSTVRAVTPKQGRRGPLVFVLVEHRIETDAGLALVEEQDLVYREPAGNDAAAAEPPRAGEGAWRRSWRPDPVLLFRYSALTYNGHRIHYDADYARGEEGYRGLVVHGPLLATLMLDLLRRGRPGAAVASFRFRAVAPLIAGEALVVHGEPAGDGSSARLWVAGPGGRLAMEGEAALAPDLPSGAARP